MQFVEVAALVIFCLVVLLVVLLVLVPVSVQLPAWTKLHARVPVHYSSIPVVGVLIMLACGCLDGKTLAAGIIGDSSLKPYGIVILFMALAYISTSLDMTGCFGWLALHITRRSKGNGRLLFMLYFAVSSIITIFTSNDISIMTLTPIIYYFSAATATDPIPFLTAMFTAANIWSMLLFVGNPTNIIVAVAYQMSFADYSKWMALPTLGAGLSCLAALLIVHAKHIPRRLTLPDLQPSMLLLDKPGAAFGSLNIIACLALLAAAPSIGWELWPITLVCAGLHAVYNFVAYVIYKGRWCRQIKTPKQAKAAMLEAAATCCEAAASGVRSTAGAESAGASSTDHHDVVAACLPPGVVVVTNEQHQQQPEGTSWTSRHEQHAGPGTDAALDEQGHQDTAAAPVLLPRQQQAHEQLQQQQLKCEIAGSQQRITSSSPETSCRGLPALWPPDQTPHSATTTAGHSAADGSGTLGDGMRHYAFDTEQPHVHQQLPVQLPESSLQQSSLEPDVQVSVQQHPQHSLASVKQSTASASAAAGLLQDLKQPSFGRVLRALPYEVVPFVLGMFILVEGLNATGWVDRLAWWLGNGVRGSVWAALFAVGSFSVLLANLANNQPCTILMTRVCMSPAFAQAAAALADSATNVTSQDAMNGTGPGATPTRMSSLSSGGSRVPVASAFAVVIASNVAANYTVMGALAGIMFVNILQRKGLKRLGYATFSRLMLPSGIASTIVALAVLGAEFATWQ